MSEAADRLAGAARQGAHPVTAELLPFRHAAQGGIECLLRRLPPRSLRIDRPTHGSLNAAVVRAVERLGLVPLVVHSTSWREDAGGVILTFAVPVLGDLRSGRAAFVAVDPGGIVGGGALSAPERVDVMDVVRHALRHLAWLYWTDSVVRQALSHWRESLTAFAPRPFETFATVGDEIPDIVGGLARPTPRVGTVGNSRVSRSRTQPHESNRERDSTPADWRARGIRRSPDGCFPVQRAAVGERSSFAPAEPLDQCRGVHLENVRQS